MLFFFRTLIGENLVGVGFIFFEFSRTFPIYNVENPRKKLSYKYKYLRA